MVGIKEVVESRAGEVKGGMGQVVEVVGVKGWWEIIWVKGVGWWGVGVRGVKG